MCNLPSLVEIMLLIKRITHKILCYNTILTQICQLFCVISIVLIELLYYKRLFCVTNHDLYYKIVLEYKIIVLEDKILVLEYNLF